MKKHTFNRSLLLLLALAVCSTVAKQGFRSQRLNLYPTNLYPSQAIQDALSAIFTQKFVAMLKDIDQLPNIEAQLKEAGFKILQYLPAEHESVIVVEHASIPGYVLKFSRTPDIELNFVHQRFGGKRQWGSLKIRVENARRLQEIVRKDRTLTSIKVAQKYLFYSHNFPIVIAEKAIIHTKKNISEMNFEQLKALLTIVEKSNSVIDIKPDNILFDGTNIYLIDTERIAQNTPQRTKDIVTFFLPRFKAAIDPRYVPCVEEWYNNLDKPHITGLVCPRTAPAASS